MILTLILITKPVKPKKPKVVKSNKEVPEKFDASQFSDIDRESTILYTSDTISPEKATQIARSMIPGITDDQIEFVHMHILNSNKSNDVSLRTLGKIRGRVMKLGIIEGTEKDPKVFKETTYHELMHLLWNFYIPFKTKQGVLNYINKEYPETNSMTHIELDEFIARKFQTYIPGETGNILQRLFNKFISWFNLLINKEKSLYSLFDDIHQGKYSAKKDYATKNFKKLVSNYNNNLNRKLSQLEENGLVSKVCK